MTKDDLLRFCAPKETGRPKLEAPWSAGEHTYASNGHLIVRVPRLADVPESEVAPKMNGFFPYDEPKEWFALAAIDMPAFIELVECDECDGDKTITHEDCSDCEGHKCENCNGAGKVETITKIPVGCAHFQHKYLLWLKELPNCKLGPEYADKQAPFQFDGGDGLILPMRGPY